VSDGTKEFVPFLLKIDFEEVLFIPVPEEVIESLDEIPDVPSDLDFLWIFHFFLPSFLFCYPCIPSGLVSWGVRPGMGGDQDLAWVFSVAGEDYPERRALDPYGDTVMFETVQEGVNEGFSLKEVVPFGVIQIGRDDAGFFSITFPHEFKESIDLFRFQGEVPQLVNQKEIVTAEALDEFWGGSVRQRGVEFIQEILGEIEPSPVSGEQSLT